MNLRITIICFTKYFPIISPLILFNFRKILNITNFLIFLFFNLNYYLNYIEIFSNKCNLNFVCQVSEYRRISSINQILAL